jgi:recombination protein RecT
MSNTALAVAPFRDLLNRDLSDRLKTWVRPGSSVTAESLMRIALLESSKNIVLREPRYYDSLCLALITAAQLGLEPSGPMGEAHLITRGGIVNLEPGYRGIIKLMTESESIVRVRSHVVYKNDECVINLGERSSVVHRPCLTERGDAIGVYAIATMSDGECEIEFMSWAEVDKVKALAVNSPAWKKWPEQMARKTVIKRMANQMPLGRQARTAIAVDNRIATGDFVSAKDVIDVGDDPVDVPSKDGADLKDRLRAKKAARPQSVPTIDTTTNGEPPPIEHHDEPEGVVEVWGEAACGDCGQLPRAGTRLCEGLCVECQPDSHGTS